MMILNSNNYIQLKFDNFQSYYSYRHKNYGSDQDLMIRMFAMRQEFTESKFLDHCDYGQNNPQDFPCVKTTHEQLESVKISSSQQELFNFLKNNNLDNWSGEPVDARGEYTDFLLSKPEFDCIAKEVQKNNLLQEFYGVGT